jgi:hypothetical protein
MLLATCSPRVKLARLKNLDMVIAQAHNKCIGGLEIQESMQVADEPRKRSSIVINCESRASQEAPGFAVLLA